VTAARVRVWVFDALPSVVVAATENGTPATSAVSVMEVVASAAVIGVQSGFVLAFHAATRPAVTEATVAAAAVNEITAVEPSSPVSVKVKMSPIPTLAGVNRSRERRSAGARVAAG
jgi:hypothetical protein